MNYYNVISVIGNEADRSRFEADLHKCLRAQNHICGLCQLKKFFLDRKHLAYSPFEFRSGTNGNAWEIEVVTLDHSPAKIFARIALSYPRLLFRIKATAETSRELFEEQFIYFNRQTLFSLNHTAFRKNTCCDKLGQIITKGCSIVTDDGEKFIIDNVKPLRAKNLSRRANSIKITLPSGSSKSVETDRIERVNIWEQEFQPLIDKLCENPLPRFDIGELLVCSTAQDCIREKLEFYPFLNLAVTRHSFGDWGIVEPKLASSNSMHLLLGGAIISKFNCYDDVLIIVTNHTRTETKAVFESDLTYGNN